VAPRVAILSPVPVPYREPLFRALAERGRVDPHVIYLTARQGGWDQAESWFPDPQGYSSEVLRSWQRRRAGRSPVTFARGIGPALRRARPDCVVSTEYGPATLRALAWARPRRVPLVVVSELTPPAHAALPRPQRRLHRLLAPLAAGFVVTSSQGVERLRMLGVDPSRVEVALQHADLGPIRSATRPERDGGPVRVLAVGRLVPDKALDALIDAFAAAGFADGEAELELRGAGPLEPDLRARAERLGVPARFGGPAAPEELGAVYANADVLALVSSYEPFGVTLREGAAAGLPLIASRAAGAVGDVAVQDENALVVEPGDRAGLTEALTRMVREPELRARLAAGSRAVTERHPLLADVEAWERAVLAAARASRSPERPRSGTGA
jgi:glycosyltransferase involved in cell wall biosynthesis